MIPVSAVPMAPIRSSPAMRVSAAIDLMSRTSPRKARARSRIASPEAVGRTTRPERAIRSVPISVSSARTRWATAAEVMFSRRAASASDP